MVGALLEALVLGRRHREEPRLHPDTRTGRQVDVADERRWIGMGLDRLRSSRRRRHRRLRWVPSKEDPRRERLQAPRLARSTPLLEALPMEDESTWQGFEIRRDLTGSAVDGLDVAECRFVSASLTSTNFDRCRIRDSLFVECEASGALLEAVSLTRVEFRQCRLTGAVLSRGRLRDVRFAECQMREVQLRVAEGSDLQFDSCDLTEADFYGSRLVRARFFDCDLTRSDFSQADVRGAQLHGSKLDGIRGVSSLVGAVVSSAQPVPLGVQVLGALDIVIDDERE